MKIFTGLLDTVYFEYNADLKYSHIMTSVFMSLDYNGPIRHIEVFPVDDYCYGYYFYENLLMSNYKKVL